MAGSDGVTGTLSPMTLRLSARLDSIKPSVTMAVTAKAQELQRSGKDVISFGAGQPDFDTPSHIKDAVREALAGSEIAKYTGVKGIPPLLNAVCADLSSAHGLSLTPENVIVSCGAKHSLFNLFLALLNDGDEVIVPAPYWVSYPDMIRLSGGTPVIAKTSAESNFAITAAQLDELCTPKTRAIVLNTPSNPTGAVYSRAALEEIASVVLKRDLIVLSDDIYRHLVYGDAEYVSFASLSKEAAAHTVVIDGVSKAYAMTGWRIGYTAGPPPLIAAMAKVQSQSTSNPTHAAQIAALAALTGPQECVAEMRVEFNKRRLAMVDLLRAIPDVTCTTPEGAFYAFPNLSAYIGRKTPSGESIVDDVALATYVLSAAEGHIAVVPGSGFGAPGHARLSYACSLSDIEKGVARLGAALGTLK